MLNFAYEMLYRYAAPIVNHSFSLKCLPMDTHRQQICSVQLKIQPDTPVSRITDSFGNEVVYGRINRSHDVFRVLLSGTALTDRSVEEDYIKEDPFDGVYQSYSRYTVPGREICGFWQSLILPKNGYEAALYLMRQLYDVMQYCPGSTGIDTTAEQAFALGKGVCQDYAHILLSLLRMRGIPCRYVVGMMKGEGASHAWVEVHLRGYWYGLDPTHNRLVDGDYIKISHGRDYADCIVSRGVFTNRTKETLSIRVKVG